MKTGKVAKVFGIDRKTVSNWTDLPQLKKFFTLDALGEDRTQRDYSESDLLVINTIRFMRHHGSDWDQIATALESGEREKQLPPSALLVETTMPIAQFGRIVELQTSLEAAEEQIGQLQEEIDHLRQQIDLVRNEERQKAREHEQHLLDQVIKLHKEMARLEIRMEMIQKKDEEKE